jgi:hypothetical protein
MNETIMKKKAKKEKTEDLRPEHDLSALKTVYVASMPFSLKQNGLAAGHTEHDHRVQDRLLFTWQFLAGLRMAPTGQ